MECGYYDAGVCRSCTWLPRPYDEQVAAKQARARSLLADHHDLEWLPPVTGAEAAFRNKAKMVVAGTVDAPTLGILDDTGHGTDLRGCGLHEPVLHDALPVLAELVTRAGLTPYDVPGRTGELKHVVVTVSPDGELMARFVLRSTESLPRLRKHLPWLRERLPHLRVVSADLQPRHAAVLDGEQIEVLLGSTLPVRVNGFTLHLRPAGFFQTSTAVAAALYREAAAWAATAPWRSAWDLYCGVGGFALHLAATGRSVTGVEVAAEAVDAARTSAAEAGVPARFEAADATTWVRDRTDVPDLVVVNPPRRGTGPDLAAWLEGSGARHLLYSSCNPTTLARDLGGDAVTAPGACPGVRHVPADPAPGGAGALLALRLARPQALCLPGSLPLRLATVSAVPPITRPAATAAATPLSAPVNARLCGAAAFRTGAAWVPAGGGGVFSTTGGGVLSSDVGSTEVGTVGGTVGGSVVGGGPLGLSACAGETPIMVTAGTTQAAPMTPARRTDLRSRPWPRSSPTWLAPVPRRVPVLSMSRPLLSCRPRADPSTIARRRCP